MRLLPNQGLGTNNTCLQGRYLNPEWYYVIICVVCCFEGPICVITALDPQTRYLETCIRFYIAMVVTVKAQPGYNSTHPLY